MLDHLTLKVRDIEKAKVFYTAALRPLGYTAMMEFGSHVGFGAGKPDFWIAPDPDTRPTHVAFAAKERSVVDAFYEAALAAGAGDNGKPGVRADYHPTYYAAFVLDADGHNIEVVCHVPPGSAAATPKRAAKRAPSRGPSRKARGRGKSKPRRSRR
jgi:catechol 2,3-dioxygenase-like lactoylglutathione lyase family enzyme